MSDHAASPPATPGFYSQHGEDIVLCKFFARRRGPRFFVEIGMIDGKRFSNTLALEQRGWRGVCAEAHPDYLEQVRRNRPNSIVVHAAVSDRTCVSVPFYADPRGDLSSLTPRDPEQMKRRFGHWYAGYTRIDVPTRTLNDILAQARAPIGMEVVSIDIEGHELAALRGFDLEHWRPRLLILEADDAPTRADLDDHLHPHGYRFARRIGVNAIYTRSAADAWRLRCIRVNQRVCRTAHPGDPRIAEAMIIPSAYETRGQFAWRLLVNRQQTA